MRVQGEMSNMIHGVSKQPDQRKGKGQCREQINCRSNLTRGLERRAGFSFISNLEDAGLANASWSMLDNGGGNKYLMALGTDSPHFFKMDGEPCSFSFKNVKAMEYYQQNLADPKDQLLTRTILDTVFLTNKTVIPKGYDFDEIQPVPKVTWLKFGTFQPGTIIEIDTTAGNYNTTVFNGFVTVDASGVPDAGQAARTAEYNGSWHAEQMKASVADVRVSQYNNWLRFEGIAVTINQAGAVVELYEADAITAIAKIPPVGMDGDVCRIKESKDEENSVGYFVAKRVGVASNAFSEVSWKETTAVGSKGGFSEETMPHRIVRSGDAFTLEAIDWSDRQVGDLDTNPYPSFIDNGLAITSIGLFQNRLFLVSGEVVYFSASDSFYDLWRESSFYLTDADPFEAVADTNDVNVIRYAVQFDGDLILFSDNTQFMLSGNENQTYHSSLIRVAAEYKSDLKADPVVAGDRIYFGTNYGNYAGVREFFTSDFNASRLAFSITEHVKDYMEGSFSHLATSSEIDVLVCLLSRPSSSFYVYEWLIQGQEKVQQSWSTWELPEGCEVQWVGFTGSTMNAVVKMRTYAGQEFQIWTLDWDDPAGTHGLPFSLRMDARFETTATYNPDTGFSSWYAPFDREDLVFVEGSESPDPGFEVSAERQLDGSWTTPHDLTGITLIGGVRYTSKYVFTNPMLRGSDGVVREVTRLQLGRMYLNFSTVGYVQFKIEDTYGRIKTIDYNSRRMNTLTNRVSYIPTEGSQWQFGVRRNTKDIQMTLYTDDITPFTLKSADWTADYNKRRRDV